MPIKSLKDVVAWRLCVGCGVCAGFCPEQKVHLINDIDQGLRPDFGQNDCDPCQDCLLICPGLQTARPKMSDDQALIPDLAKSWGPILEIWEGYASDPEIRLMGSSGGVTTALAWYCLEHENVSGVIQIGTNPAQPLENKTFLSHNRMELLARTGSRYTPASPGDSLKQIMQAPAPVVFIGKPCDVSGVYQASQVRPALNQKIALTFGIFCAGTPATRGILNLLNECRLATTEVQEIRYRGNGWPGDFTILTKGDRNSTVKLSYREAWGNLQKYRPFRCYLCPDATSECADIACGDPWYREIQPDDPGHSLILVRTEKGRQILHRALDAGYLQLTPAPPEILAKSQINLLQKRQEIWGRLAALKLFGIPTPRYRGFHLFSNWWQTDLKTKMRTILGTIRRIIIRKYYRPLKNTN
ncbi:Coenzyme F420 hydrogenase/dehydrogenase, beta subunit C-terminal domain [candidate division KSB1 bacterium]|nr:Coenzyme F420 hydrogenase/dehydrogenase, beta subunit C-terminal domain [candidate division KSB1 bacterium]